MVFRARRLSKIVPFLRYTTRRMGGPMASRRKANIHE
jgi:hypothetical protein